MRKAFSLIELLVVVSIIALLIAILLPVLSKARESARQTKCMSNLSQQGKATLVYATDRDGYLPVARDSTNVLFRNHMSRWFRSANHGNENLGYVWDAGVMETGEIFFCPSMTHPGYSWDTYREDFPTNRSPFPGWSSGIRSSYNHNPMTMTQTNRERRYQNIEAFKTGAVLLGMDLVENSGNGITAAHKDGFSTLRGDLSTHLLLYADVSDDIQNVSGIHNTNYASWDAILNSLMGGIDYAWYQP
ncbi:MAG: prepilin-type N-terminal cleavage/methylation domain-containing protein [Phycisphaeraceae bacterium]